MRKVSAFVIGAVLLLVTLHVGAEQVSFEQRYKKLFENPSSDPSDYRKLRDEYVKLPSFNPGFERYKNDIQSAAESYGKGDCDNAIKYGNKILEAEPINIQGHWVLHLCYKAKGKESLAELHQHFSDNVLNSIVSSGEFGDPHKPFHIVVRYELYSTIDFLGMDLEQVMPVIDGHNGHGVWAHIKKKGTGEKGIIFFETNAIEKWEEKQKSKTKSN